MRDERIGAAKKTLRRWFAGQSDEYLIRVLEECRAGVFCFSDRCHCLLGLLPGGYPRKVRLTQTAIETLDFRTPVQLRAEAALNTLGCDLSVSNAADELGRIRTHAMVLAEIRRRTKQQARPEAAVEVEA